MRNEASRGKNGSRVTYLRKWLSELDEAPKLERSVFKVPNSKKPKIPINVPLVKGVYFIRNDMTKKTYVGSSVCMFDRVREHVGKLRRGKHEVAELQSDWLRCGESWFTVGVLELVDSSDDLVVREQWWLNCIELCRYNRSPVAKRFPLIPGRVGPRGPQKRVLIPGKLRSV